MKIIGISGKIGCGKSTVARRVAERLGWRVTSFGARLKDEVAELFRFPREWCDTIEGKDRVVDMGEADICSVARIVVHGKDGKVPQGMTVRELLQVWGTEVRRARDPDYWVKAMEDFLGRNHGGWVIDDVRFPNEAKYIRDLDGLLARLDPYQGWELGPHAGHVSETALDEYERFDLRLAPALGDLTSAVERVVELAAIRLGNIKLGVEFNRDQVRHLLACFGEQSPDEVPETWTVREFDEGHAGPGLYAYLTDYPNEGAEFLGTGEEG